jgi:hypothetical protein
MKIDRIGKILYAYHTDVYVQVYQHTLTTIIKLENLYIPLMICRDSIARKDPIFTIDKTIEIWSEPQFILPTQDKWIR